MEAKQKRGLRRRLLYIYVAYFAVLAVGVIHGWWQMRENGVPEHFHPGIRINAAWLYAATAARVAILVLVAVMINILRKAVRDENVLPKRIVAYTRTVAGLLVVATVCSSMGVQTINTAFSLNYWNLFIAILILFSAEIFSIGMTLSEEQKLTI